MDSFHVFAWATPPKSTQRAVQPHQVIQSAFYFTKYLYQPIIFEYLFTLSNCQREQGALFLLSISDKVTQVLLRTHFLAMTFTIANTKCTGGSKGDARDARPTWIQFLSFSCSFRENFGKIIGWRPYLRVGAPSGKSWISH